MSFLTEAATRRIATTLQAPSRALANAAPRATFSSTVKLQRTPVEAAKDTLHSVDRAVSDKLVDGINIGSTVASKVKEATENVTAGDIKGKANEMGATASGKASHLAGQAKGAAAEMTGKAKGTASEMAGKAEGTAEQWKGKAKGAAEQAKQQT